MSEVNKETFDQGVSDLIQHRPEIFAQILIKIVTKDSPSDYRKIIAYIEHGIAMSGSQGVQIHPESISEWEFIVECVIQHVRLVHERANQVKNQEELTMAKIEVETQQKTFESALQSINTMSWWRRLFKRFKF